MQQSDKVERVRPEDMPRQSSGSSGGIGGGLGGLKAIIIPLLISLIVTYGLLSFWAMPNMVSKKDFTANTQSIATQEINDVAKLQKAVTELSTTITTLQNSIQNTITEKLNAQNATIDQKIANINLSSYAKLSALDSLNSSISSLNTQIAQLQTSVTALKTADTSFNDAIVTLNNLKAQLATDEASIKALQSQLTTDEKTIANLQTQVTAMGTSTPGGTVTGAVTAAITTNIWGTGGTVLNYPAYTAAGTQTQSLSFTVNNGLNRAITNVQLALGLQVVNTSGATVDISGGTYIFAVTSSGMTTVWTQQSTGIPYMVGFSNTVTTGIFGGLGAINQNAGSTTYTVNVNVTSSAITTSAINVYPVVKVVSYN